MAADDKYSRHRIEPIQMQLSEKKLSGKFLLRFLQINKIWNILKYNMSLIA